MTAGEMSVDEAIARYIQAVHDYNLEARYQCPSFSVIESPLFEIAEAVLRISGSDIPLFHPSDQVSLSDSLKAPIKASIPSGLRWDIWERDDFTCQSCGSRRNLSVDHIIAESRGGSLQADNLQTLCRSCNSKKGTGP